MEGHSHSHFGDMTKQSTVRIATAFVLTLAFVAVEAFAGLLSNSLALLSDAGHNLTDAVALGLSWYAMRLSTQPASSAKTYGYHRAGILVALVNSTTLVLISLGIFYAAYQRFLATPEVQPDIVIQVGFVALLVNAGTAWLVMHGREHDLNLRSTFAHLMGDVLSTIGTIAAGVAIAFTGVDWLDPLAGVLIGLLILWNAWDIMLETVEILLESTPRDIDMSQIVRDLMNIDGVRSVHDLHVWSISQKLRVLSAHIVIDDISISSSAIIHCRINDMIRHKYHIGHATLQLECIGCEPDLLYCDIVEHHDHSHDSSKHKVETTEKPERPA